MFTTDNSKMRSLRDYRGYLCGLWPVSLARLTTYDLLTASPIV
jgi:hypothetical protein